MDRDPLPKDSFKKLGLFKINLLPKKHPLREIVNKLSLLTQPPVSRIDWTYNNPVYKKKKNLQEKNLIYTCLTNNI
jgi:hypothetical protein